MCPRSILPNLWLLGAVVGAVACAAFSRTAGPIGTFCSTCGIQVLSWCFMFVVHVRFRFAPYTNWHPDSWLRYQPAKNRIGFMTIYPKACHTFAAHRLEQLTHPRWDDQTNQTFGLHRDRGIPSAVVVNPTATEHAACFYCVRDLEQWYTIFISALSSRQKRISFNV